MLKFLFLFIFNNIYASKYGGYFSVKEKKYLEDNSSSSGSVGNFRIYEETNISKTFFSKLEGRVEYNSTALDFNDKYRTKNRDDLFDLYFGETYLRYKRSGFILQGGYQEIVWGESFGFNYADFITPKNLNSTFLSEADDSRRPIPSLQSKILIGDTSFQLIYGPKSEFSINYPLAMFFRDTFKTETLTVEKEKTEWFKEHEGGAKITTTIVGMDLSAYAYSYRDRVPYLEIKSWTPGSELIIQEKHARVTSVGFSFSTTVSDFVLRGDFLKHKNKKVNGQTATGIESYKVSENNFVLSLDTPTYSGYSFFVIAAMSELDTEISNAFRTRVQKIGSLKVTKEFTNKIKGEFVYFNDLDQKNSGLQLENSWNLNDQIDVALGGEFYFGKNTNISSKFKKFNNVFVKFKNFFSF